MMARGLHAFCFGEGCMTSTDRHSGCAVGLLGLFRGRYVRPLAIGMSLMLFQQITGQPSVLYYAADIFAKAGFAAGKDATGVSLLLGLWKLVMTGVRATSCCSKLQQLCPLHACSCASFLAKATCA
jgi:hypothetical protein